MDIPRKILREGRELTLVIEKCTLRRGGKLQEGTGDKTGWTCDVWKLGEKNLNGRVYTKALAERLVKESPVTIVNDGHFADWCNGNEYENAKAVAKNLRIEGDYLKCDLDFIDEAYEKKLETLSDKGVAIGVSSVGYGEYKADGETIEEETYTVVRIVDFVTQPAGEVYARKVEDDDTPDDDEGKKKPDDDGQNGSMEPKKESLSLETRKAIIRRLSRRK